MAIRFGCAFIIPVASAFYRYIITDGPASAKMEDQTSKAAIGRTIKDAAPSTKTKAVMEAAM